MENFELINWKAISNNNILSRWTFNEDQGDSDRHPVDLLLDQVYTIINNIHLKT